MSLADSRSKQQPISRNRPWLATRLVKSERIPLFSYSRVLLHLYSAINAAVNSFVMKSNIKNIFPESFFVYIEIIKIFV